MKSLFEEMGGTYRQEGDYLISNLALPDEPEYQIGKYGRMRRSYLKEHRPVLYANLLTCGALHRVKAKLFCPEIAGLFWHRYIIKGKREVPFLVERHLSST